MPAAAGGVVFTTAPMAGARIWAGVGVETGMKGACVGGAPPPLACAVPVGGATVAAGRLLIGVAVATTPPVGAAGRAGGAAVDVAAAGVGVRPTLGFVAAAGAVASCVLAGGAVLDGDGLVGPTVLTGGGTTRSGVDVAVGRIERTVVDVGATRSRVTAGSGGGSIRGTIAA